MPEKYAFVAFPVINNSVIKPLSDKAFSFGWHLVTASLALGRKAWKILPCSPSALQRFSD